MRYESIEKGIFISRPNRFTANVSICGREEVCHVKNTGRCRELLVPGAEVCLNKEDSEKRKTKWDLVSVYKGERLINIDSSAPNSAAREWISGGGLGFIPTYIKPEYSLGSSRYDFYVENGDERHIVEVKGVTLEDGGAVFFPDAPTLRGVKHLEGLMQHVQDGFKCAVLFVIQMRGVKYFAPNSKTHPEFARVLEKASECGVDILAYDCEVTPCSMEIRDSVKICLTGSG